VLPLAGWLHLTAEYECKLLHTIADAQHRMVVLRDPVPTWLLDVRRLRVVD
jgi:hypothetical protein